MKLQSKILLSILTTLTLIYVGAQVVQQMRARALMQGMAAASLRDEETVQWDVARRVLQSSESALIGAMAAGEMDTFKKTIASQASVQGVLEMSLHDPQGVVAYSSVPARVKQGLPTELKEPLLGAGQEQVRRTTEAFEIFRPVAITPACLECHPAYKNKRIAGVLAYRFSTAGLVAAGQRWQEFVSELGHSLLWQAVLTSGILLVAVGGVIVVVARRQITRPLEHATASIGGEASCLEAAAAQVRQSSSSLADGASQQAAALEESSASLEEMASMTKRNAESAHSASEATARARESAEAGVGKMSSLSGAMSGIKSASEEITKILKTIDEIAFQTNILALNAAVEAARAGEAGMGFAVVAEEVRNLAQRCALAARETATKIEDSVARSQEGVAITTDVARTFDDIVNRIRQLDQLVGEIARASAEQQEGIGQINRAVSEMDKVTQMNAASAEECAAAATQLSSQSGALLTTVSELTRLVHGRGAPAQPTSDAPAAVSSPRASANASWATATVEPSPRLKLPPAPPPAAATGDLVQWDPAKMATGVSSVDEQHQELITMINRLHRACREGRGKDEVRQMMGFLADYVKTHFSHEEEIMARRNCPSKVANKAAHDKFLRDFTDLVTAFESDETRTAIVLDLGHLVGDWLRNHICTIDRRLRGCGAGHAHDRQSATPTAGVAH